MLGLGPGLEFGLGFGFEGRGSAVIGPQASSSSNRGQRGSMVCSSASLTWLGVRVRVRVRVRD